MKQLFGLLISILIAGFTCAQVPQKFSFQGVARDASNKVIANQTVSLRISIRVGTVIGETVYRETHSTQTSASGVFNISVGGGSAELGQIDQIDWAGASYVLQVEMAIDGSTNYVNLGATQLLSVPYALHSAEAGRWKNVDPVVQEGRLFQGPILSVKQSEPNNLVNDVFMIWYPRKGAFRFGSRDNAEVFIDENMGYRSFASGFNMLAKGTSSVAMGTEVQALGNNSAVIGYRAKAVGLNSIVLGYNSIGSADYSTSIGGFSKSLGMHSTSIGYNLQSNSKYGIVIGMSNDTSDIIDNDLKPTHRLFQIGNGDESTVGARRNALTVLKNGNVGIGNNVLMPTHILDVGHRMRLRSNTGYTAGIWLDNSDHVPYSFIGGNNNSEVGIYFEEGTAWRFNVHKNGSAWLAGTLTQNSDFRLKRDIVPLSANFEKLSSISGRHYYWKDPQRHQGLQTGLIAQEVEEVFPELVETDKDGFKSVNYIGLIPHLLEAVKELKRENARLGSENKKLASNATKWADLQTRIEAIEASLVHSQATSSK